MTSQPCSVLTLLLIANAVVFECGAVSHNDDFIVTPDKEMTTLINVTGHVWHLDSDLFLPGNILFSEWNALKTTDGNFTELLVGDVSERGYVEGIGDASRFYTINSFVQLSQYEVVVVDRYNDCLRLINRLTLQTSPYAGVCTNQISANTRSIARFADPHSVIRDVKQPDMLLLSDQLTHSIKHVSTRSSPPHNFSTFFRSTELRFPQGFVQDPIMGDLFVTAVNQVFRLVYSTKSLQLIVGMRSSPEWRDGDFSTALIKHPDAIAIISRDILAAVSGNSNRIRILNMKTNETSTLCTGVKRRVDGDMRTCSMFEAQSLMVKNGSLYVGEVRAIRKISGTSLVRTLTLRYKYPIHCSSLSRGVSSAGLTATLSQRVRLIQQEICQTDCKMVEDPVQTCADDTLTIDFPTDTVYLADVTSVPASLKQTLDTRLSHSHLNTAEIMLFSRMPFLIRPKSDRDGKTVRVVLVTHCVDKNKVYSPSRDDCVDEQ